MSTFQSSFGSQFYTANDKQEPCFGITIPQKQFKRSQNTGPHFGLTGNKQKLNIKQFQFQQKIVMLKIELKIQSIFDTLEPKVQNIKRNAFKNLQSVQNPEQVVSMQQSLCVQTVQNIFSKICSFSKRQQIKHLSKGFSQILLRNIFVSKVEANYKAKKKPSDKRESQMLRVNSKVDQNSMHISDLIGDGEGSNYSSAVNPKTKNKQLKKQKQKIEQNHNYLLSQFQQILAPHQQYLKKR